MTPPTRRVALLLSTAVLLGALAVGASGQRLVHSSSAYRLTADARAPLSANRLAQAPITYRGGPITTSTGEIVDVRVSDALPPETSTPEGWAEFLAQLTHGPEIAQLTTYLVTFDEVQQICGSRALGCYGDDRVVAPGEIAADISPEEILRHEYGHHVANHRSNRPWIAIDWGPKLWSSAASVCARVGRREAYPGDQGSNYALNPGEAWAETYRLMDERKVGITSATWRIVASTFFPSEAALQAAELDVTKPWATPRTTVSTRVFGRRTPKVWWIRLATPLDGDFRVTATVPNGGTHEVALVGANRATVVKRATWTGQRVKRLDGTVCGQRSYFIRVTRTGALGRVRVSVTIP